MPDPTPSQLTAAWISGVGETLGEIAAALDVPREKLLRAGADAGDLRAFMERLAHAARARHRRIAELEARLEVLRSVVQSPDSLDYGDRVVVAAAKACRIPNPYTGKLDA